MAGGKRRKNKGKRTKSRSKTRYTKRKSTKKTYKKSGRRSKRRGSKRRGRHRGPTLEEMAFAVAFGSDDPMAVGNAEALSGAAAAKDPSMFARAWQDINEDKGPI